MPGFEKYTSTTRNHAAISKPTTQSHVLTKYPDGKIYDWDARDGAPTGHEAADAWLIDTGYYRKFHEAREAGEEEKANQMFERATSPLYKDLLVEAARQRRLTEDNPYLSPTRVLLTKAAAGDGQILQTAQEVVRQINYQMKVTGVFYRMEKFQAVNLPNKISTNDLTTKGALDLKLQIGHSEIGDDQTPEPARPFFETFDKQIFADSFHYGFSMREKKDSWFNIQQRMVQKVNGVMMRMKNEKITRILLDSSQVPGTAIGTKWDAFPSGHDIPSIDAGRTIEDQVNALEDLEGPIIAACHRYVIRAYERNVEGRNVRGQPTKQPASARQGVFEFNPEVKYYVENTLGNTDLYVMAKDVWADHYYGPEIDVAYKDQMKPTQFEGRILFHFNGVKYKLKAAVRRRTGMLTV